MRLPPPSAIPLHRRRPRRGVAMLLVMIGLVVCTILTAGFLTSQGTSIGIARNERDAEKSRGYAQSGIDLCYWLILNRSDWRTSMTPGAWLSNYPVGSGSVSVTVADGDNSGNFADDPTAPAILTSTGTCNGRTFTLTSRITPTGGGTIFRGGAFALGQLTLHNFAKVDSFDSSVGPYNALFPGSNALFGSNYTGAGALTMDGLSSFSGSFIGGPNSLLGSIVSSILGLLIPTSVSAAPQVYVPGYILPPNTTGLSTYAAPPTTGTRILVPGQYPSLTSTSGSLIIPSGTYRITGDLTNAATITIPDGAKVILQVDGMTTSANKIQVQGTGQLILYIAGATTLSGTVSSAGGAANLQILGLATASTLTLKGSTSVTAAIFAPQTSVSLTDSAKLFGALIAHDVTADKTSQFHYDAATQNIRLDNISAGSAPAGDADYVITRLGAS